MVEFKKVFETEWFSIDEVADHQSKDEPYYVLSCSDSVEIMAVTEDEKIILVRQYRPAVGDYTLEFPAGYVDEHESVEEAANRELKEESGFVCAELIKMGSFKIVPNRIKNDLHFFYGKGAQAVDKHKEGSDIVLVTKEELMSLVSEGRFKEVAALAMLFLSQDYGYF